MTCSVGTVRPGTSGVLLHWAVKAVTWTHVFHVQPHSPHKSQNSALLAPINQACTGESIIWSPGTMFFTSNWMRVFSQVCCALSLGGIECVDAINQSQMVLTEESSKSNEWVAKQKKKMILAQTHHLRDTWICQPRIRKAGTKCKNVETFYKTSKMQQVHWRYIYSIGNLFSILFLFL